MACGRQEWAQWDGALRLDSAAVHHCPQEQTRALRTRQYAAPCFRGRSGTWQGGGFHQLLGLEEGESFQGRRVNQKQCAVAAMVMRCDTAAEHVVVGVGGFQLSPSADTALVHSDLACTELESTEVVKAVWEYTVLEHTAQVHTVLVHIVQEHTVLVHTGQEHTVLLHTGQESTALVHTDQRSTALVHTGQRSTALVHTALEHNVPVDTQTKRMEDQTRLQH